MSEPMSAVVHWHYPVLSLCDLCPQLAGADIRAQTVTSGVDPELT